MSSRSPSSRFKLNPRAARLRVTVCLSDWTLSEVKGHSEILPSAREVSKAGEPTRREKSVYRLETHRSVSSSGKFLCSTPSGLEMSVTGRRTCLASCTPIQSALACLVRPSLFRDPALLRLLWIHHPTLGPLVVERVCSSLPRWALLLLRCPLG